MHVYTCICESISCRHRKNLQFTINKYYLSYGIITKFVYIVPYHYTCKSVLVIQIGAWPKALCNAHFSPNLISKSCCSFAVCVHSDSFQGAFCRRKEILLQSDHTSGHGDSTRLHQCLCAIQVCSLSCIFCHYAKIL